MPTIGLPAGTDARAWVQSEDGQYGTDGSRMFRRTERSDVDGPSWSLMLDAHVRMTTVRRPAPDPDFPERSEEAGEDTPEGAADIAVTTSRKRGAETYLYRSVTMTDLTAMKPITWAGPDACRGAKMTQGARIELAHAVNMLADEYPGGIERAPFYTATGWHTDPATGAAMFVHGGGAIDAAGSRPDVAVQVDSRLSRYTLAEPATGEDLLEAFELSAALMTSISPRVIVPLIGAMLRSPFGVFKGSGGAGSLPLAWISGNTGLGKSGALAAALNHQDASAMYNSLPFKAGSSKGGGGASVPGLERILYAARDLVVCFDDLDPSEPESVRAGWQSTLLRAAADQKSRLLAEGGGSSRARAERPCRAMVMGTGEPMDGEASAENRAVNIALHQGDVSRPGLRDATSNPADRAQRAAFLAGIIRLLAADRPRYLARLAAARVSLRPLFAAGDVPGPVDRGADSFAELAGTWYVVLGMLTEHAGMSRSDARGWWTMVRDALVEAWRGHLAIIGASDRASRAVSYLSEALESGRAHLSSVESPDGPPTVGPSLYGWEKRGTGPDELWASRGDRIGWRHDQSGDLYLLPSVATGAIKSVADRADDAWTGSTKTLGATFRAGGFLHVTESRARRGEIAGRGPTLGDGSRPANVWHLRADALTTAGGDLYRAGEYAGVAEYTTVPGPHLPPYGDDGPDGGPEGGPESIPDPPGPPAAPAVRSTPAPRPAVDQAPAVDVPPQPAPVDVDQPSAAPTRVPAARARTRTAAADTGSVVTVTGGRIIPAGRGAARTLESEEAASLPALLDRLSTYRGPVTAVIADDMLTGYGITGPRPKLGKPWHRAFKPAADAGWGRPQHPSERPYVGPWSTLGKGEHVVSLVVPAWLDESEFPRGRQDTEDVDAGTLAGRLAVFARLTGWRYTTSSARTALDSVRRAIETSAKRQPRWRPANIAECPITEPSLMWQREETDAEKTQQHRHQYDAVKAYLGATTQAVISGDGLTPTGPRVFDRNTPGMWQIETPYWPHELVPAPLIGVEPGTHAWASTSLVALYEDAGISPEILDSWTGTRVQYGALRGWQEKVRDVLDSIESADSMTADQVAVRDAVKQLYQRLHGKLRDVNQGTIVRPDWGCAIRDAALANTLRKVYRAAGITEKVDTPRVPLYVNYDAVRYASDVADPTAAAPAGIVIGTRLGQFKVEEFEGEK